MGKPGNKNQSSISNIFKRVPNYNYEKQSSEAIVPGIGNMGEQSSENVYMSDASKSPLQMFGFSSGANEAASAGAGAGSGGGITGAMGSDLRKSEYDAKKWAYDHTIAGDHEGAFQPKVDPATANVEESPVVPVEDGVAGDVVEGDGGNAVMLDEVEVTAAPTGRAKRIANMDKKISETVGDQEDGTTSDKNQAKAKRLGNRKKRMEKRAGNKAKRVAKRERVANARKEPVAPKEEIV